MFGTKEQICKTLELRRKHILLEEPREVQCNCKLYNVQGKGG